ncbi:MAG: IPTL-CTERM sorting domain-containing protein, partial [Gemmatimonadaceae bacterium]|nr:IPTL-CTERM sorting domain-containing protein [Gemmatimonadaceae bacterium]
PTVSGISPANGPASGGTAVAISGANFTGATAVVFGSASATILGTPTNATINVLSPVGTAGTTVDVRVTTPGGQSAIDVRDRFSYDAILVPTVTGISPSSGPASGGTSVAITGTHLTGATAVAFGSASATIVGISGNGTLNVTSPAGTAGATVDVRVTTPAGQSATNATAQFTYNPSTPAPTVTGISPEAGPTSGGTSVLITGTSFTSGSSVRFGTRPAGSVQLLSTSQLRVSSPAGTDTASEVVSVSTPSGNATSPRPFTWCGVPVVTGVFPTTVKTGDTVTLTGSNFCASALQAVTFTYTNLQSLRRSVNATQYSVVSSTSVLAVVPTSVSSNVTASRVSRVNPQAVTSGVLTGVSVSVVTAGGSSPEGPGSVVTVTPAPAVGSITPTTGPVQGGTTVTIDGADFSGASAVRFGAVAATSFTVVSDTRIIATAPPNAAGAVDIIIVTPAGISTATSASSFIYGIGVPTMGEWFMGLLALLLVGVGFLALRRRSHVAP